MRNVILFLCLLAACADPSPKTEIVPIVSKGKALMELHCQGCHQLPNPALLDKKTWKNHVLVRMSAFLGIFNDGLQYFDSLPAKWLEPGEGGQAVLAAGTYPPKPILSREDWEKLRDYILNLAPSQILGAAAAGSVPDNLNLFEVRPLLSKNKYAANVAALKIMEGEKKIFAGFYKQEIVSVQTDGKLLDSHIYTEAPVQFLIDKGRFAVVNIGNIKALDNPIGEVNIATSFNEFKKGNVYLQWKKLKRPVNLNIADLDLDGDDDIVLCEFGNLIGNMSLYNNGPNGYTKEILFADDGATRAIVQDMNADGLPDIVALMANADEGIDVFLNKGKLQFEKKRVLRFDPCYGSTSMQLIDWDKDGDMDILYGNGDNGDYQAILKPFHGIRLFENKGELNFKESFFYPVNGVYRAIAEDYDLDGDFDIAAVSFYPDFSTGARESFIFLKNNGKNQFQPSTIKGFDSARWMVMDVEDADGDGDKDIVLGAFNVKSSEVAPQFIQNWEAKDIPILFLENKAR